MTVSEIFARIQSLPRLHQIEIYKRLHDELSGKDLEPLPEGFPPPEDHCPYTREQLEYAHRQPGICTLDEIWRRLGVQ